MAGKKIGLTFDWRYFTPKQMVLFHYNPTYNWVFGPTVHPEEIQMDFSETPNSVTAELLAPRLALEDLPTSSYLTVGSSMESHGHPPPLPKKWVPESQQPEESWPRTFWNTRPSVHDNPWTSKQVAPIHDTPMISPSWILRGKCSVGICST